MTLPAIDDNGQVWWDGVPLPTVRVETIWARPDRAADLNRWGFAAALASENGAEVELIVDPTAWWRNHPVRMEVTVRLIPGRVIGGEILFDPDCEGGECRPCGHVRGAWCEQVTSPAEVLAHLRSIGSLPIREAS